MASFLGIQSKGRRVKRFWQALFLAAVPIIAQPLGETLVKKIFGENTDEAQLDDFHKQIGALERGYQDLNYKIEQQATFFKIDSERKDYQIQWLGRTKNEIKDKIKILEGTFSVDAEEKAKEIKNLQEMLTETQNKLKRQEDIQNNLVNEIENIKSKVKSINDDIDFVYKAINETNERIDQIKLDVKLNSMSSNFNFLLTEFEIKQRELLGVIKNANRGYLDPYIITPLNLIQMLVEMKAMLPEGTNFPFHANIENAQNLYKIIQPTVYFYKGKIMFILTIPLVNLKTFHLQKVTSLPTPISGNKFGFILPKRPYLLVDRADKEYMTLTYENFQSSCQKIANVTFLCDQIQQTSLASLYKSECEIQLLVGHKILDTCNKRVASLEKTLFFQLMEPGAWIYATPSTDNLVISCPRNKTTIAVSGVGVLRTGGCTVRTPDLNLLTIAKFSTPVLSSYSPKLNLGDSIDGARIEQWEGRELQGNRQIISPFEYVELGEISWNVKDVPESSTNTQTVTYVGAVLGSVFVLLIVSFVLFILYRRHCQDSNRLEYRVMRLIALNK